MLTCTTWHDLLDSIHDRVPLSRGGRPLIVLGRVLYSYNCTSESEGGLEASTFPFSGHDTLMRYSMPVS